MAASSATPSGTPPPPIGDSKKHHLLEIAPFGSPRADRNRVAVFLLADWREAPRKSSQPLQPVPILSRRPEIVAPEAKDGRNASDYDLIRLRGMDNPALRCSSASSRSVKKTTSRPAHRNAPSR